MHQHRSLNRSRSEDSTAQQQPIQHTLFPVTPFLESLTWPGQPKPPPASPVALQPLLCSAAHQVAKMAAGSIHHPLRTQRACGSPGWVPPKPQELGTDWDYFSSRSCSCLPSFMEETWQGAETAARTCTEQVDSAFSADTGTPGKGSNVRVSPVLFHPAEHNTLE